jgi:hypothetical protein
LKVIANDEFLSQLNMTTVCDGQQFFEPWNMAVIFGFDNYKIKFWWALIKNWLDFKQIRLTFSLSWMPISS